MKLFSDPTDLFSLVLSVLTLSVVILITLVKDMTRTQKYGALALTFLFSAIVGLLAIYSFAIDVGFCFGMAAIFLLLWLRWRKGARGGALSSTCCPELVGNSNATLLPESNPLPLKTIRLLGRG